MGPPSQRPERPDFPFFQSPSPLKIGVFAANFGEIGSFGENLSLAQIAHLFPVLGVQNCIFSFFCREWPGLWWDLGKRVRGSFGLPFGRFFALLSPSGEAISGLLERSLGGPRRKFPILSAPSGAGVIKLILASIDQV